MGKTKHTGPIKLPSRPDPKLWVSKVPFGLGQGEAAAYSRNAEGRMARIATTCRMPTAS